MLNTLGKLSITNRLLLAGSLVLAAFLGLSAISLNNAFQASAESAQQQRLQNHIYTLLTAIDLYEHDRFTMSETLAEPDFSKPHSGLYAQITQDGKQIWQSNSILGFILALPPQNNYLVNSDKDQNYYLSELDDGTQLMNFVSDITWETEEQEIVYRLHVAENTESLNQQIAEFSRILWYWLGGTGLLLLLVQAAILRWGLQPLHTVSEDLQAIESGTQQRLAQNYPSELNQLTTNINTLLDHEQSRRERYKNSLADLAHSLKTPIAVLQGELEKKQINPEFKKIAQEQLDRVTSLVNHQLQRAATTGKGSLLTYIDLTIIINKLIGSLDKVYQQKGMQCHFDSVPLSLHADESDMYELLGNLLENAYKYGKQKVHITTKLTAEKITLAIADDGDGIPPHAADTILQRGKRIDSQVEGQGIGLAVASDIIAAYEGEIEIKDSTLGGACFIVTLPRH